MTIPAASSPTSGDASFPRPDASAADKDAQCAVSFADLLASLQQAMRVATDLPSHGLPSTDAKADAVLPDPRSFLGTDQSTTTQDTRLPSSVAEIFNEHGLMQALDQSISQAAGTTVAGDTESPQGQAAASRAPPPALGPGQSAPVPSRQAVAGPVLAPPAFADRAAHPWTARDEGPRPMSAFRSRRGAAATPASRSAVGSAIDAGAMSEAGGAAVPSFKASRLRAIAQLLHQAHSSDAQLFFEIAEQGLRIFARAGKLTREERVRLRSEIARLAAAYGLPAIEIRLNGEAAARNALPREES